ncbi:MAG: phosphoribosyltransferase [Caldilineaceae bacterium]
MISKLIFKLNTPYDAILVITRGGIIPGGMIAEALRRASLTGRALSEDPGHQTRLSWPRFLQFPADPLLTGRKILVVDNLWFRGRTIMAVKGRIETAGGYPELAVIHWKKTSSVFPGPGAGLLRRDHRGFHPLPWQRIDDSDYRTHAGDAAFVMRET